MAAQKYIGVIKGTVTTKVGLIVPKSNREGRQDRRKRAIPRTNLIRSG
jgi:hypothetical protein